MRDLDLGHYWRDAQDVRRISVELGNRLSRRDRLTLRRAARDIEDCREYLRNAVKALEMDLKKEDGEE